MMRFSPWIIVTLLFLQFHTALPGQENCPCCTTEHDHFDFWVGEWMVYDTSDNLIGENTIEELESNCLISEYWRGASGSTGRSFNYFDPQDSTWNQLWVASSGGNLKLKGNWTGKSMELTSEISTNQKGNLFYNRISWTPREDGSVVQQWDILGEQRQFLQTVFLGIYKRKASK